MTEKVISLTGGLALGLVFALFLGIGVTQSITLSSDFKIPSVFQMTFVQHTHSPSAHASDTTPSVNVITPDNPDRGRITRIATLEITTDPVFDTTSPTSYGELKDWMIASTPKVESSLQRNNLQRSYIASNPRLIANAVFEQSVTRESNFTLIASNSTARNSCNSRHTPLPAYSKPQTTSAAHYHGDNHSANSAMASSVSKPGSIQDTVQVNNNILNYDPDPNFIDSPENDPGSYRIGSSNLGRTFI